MISSALVQVLGLVDFNSLGYVIGIWALGTTPKARLTDGALTSITGPIAPMTIEKKMAGFSWAAQVMYLTGVRQK